MIDLPGISTEYVVKPNIKKITEAKLVDSTLTTNNELVVVKKGDSLWAIAKRYYGDGHLYIQLAKDNNLVKNAHLEIGQKLTVKRLVNLKIASTELSSQLSPILGEHYTVVKGDSLAKIALRAYGDSYAWAKIWHANKKMIAKPGLIYSGNVLVIPRI